MGESSSTLRVPFRWAAKKDRTAGENLPTGFFLFQEEEGRIGVRERAERDEISFENYGDAVEATADVNTDKHFFVAKAQRVPQTRLVKSQPDQRYILLKKYEGFVTTRGEDSFSARLFENNSDYPVLEAEFDLEELSEIDRNLAVEGASLVWTIGYAYEGSTRKRESFIYLRRLPAWSDKELENARSEADELTRGVQWE